MKFSFDTPTTKTNIFNTFKEARAGTEAKKDTSKVLYYNYNNRSQILQNRSNL